LTEKPFFSDWKNNKIIFGGDSHRIKCWPLKVQQQHPLMFIGKKRVSNKI
jgi:hypothetical protein